MLAPQVGMMGVQAETNYQNGKATEAA